MFWIHWYLFRMLFANTDFQYFSIISRIINSPIYVFTNCSYSLTKYGATYHNCQIIKNRTSKIYSQIITRNKFRPALLWNETTIHRADCQGESPLPLQGSAPMYALPRCARFASLPTIASVLTAAVLSANTNASAIDDAMRKTFCRLLSFFLSIFLSSFARAKILLVRSGKL